MSHINIKIFINIDYIYHTFLGHFADKEQRYQLFCLHILDSSHIIIPFCTICAKDSRSVKSVLLNTRIRHYWIKSSVQIFKNAYFTNGLVRSHQMFREVQKNKLFEKKTNAGIKSFYIFNMDHQTLINIARRLHNSQ